MESHLHETKGWNSVRYLGQQGLTFSELATLIEEKVTAIHVAVFVTPNSPRPQEGCVSQSHLSGVLCSVLTCGTFIESSAMGGRLSTPSRYVDWTVKTPTGNYSHLAYDSINYQNIYFPKYTKETMAQSVGLRLFGV